MRFKIYLNDYTNIFMKATIFKSFTYLFSQLIWIAKKNPTMTLNTLKLRKTPTAKVPFELQNIIFLIL